MSTCYVLACGPSIKEQDLTKLGDNPCITISNFFVHPHFSKMNVEYHLFGELHPPITPEMGLAWFQDAEKLLAPDQKLLIHSAEAEFIHTHNIFSKQKVEFFNTGGSFPSTLPTQIDRYLSMSQAALQVGIHVALQQQIEKVVIMGIDHSWVNHPLESRHFYSEEESALVRAGYDEWHNVSSKESSINMEASNLSVLSSIYEFYRDRAAELGVKVFNGTPNSMITCLPCDYIH